MFIKKIVKVIGDKVNRRALSVTPFLIGIYPQVENINLWLQDEAVDVKVVGICGMGGIGKSTIAKVVYNLNKGKFDASSFLANIRERSQEQNALVNLQKQLLSDIGKEERISCIDDGILKIAAATCCKRLLIVLDDVDHFDQLNAMFGMRKLFSPGSRIIVTTRNEGLLNPRYIHKVHQVKHLNFEESLELFSWHAFGQDHPIEDYLEHSQRLVCHCGGLPLALEVLGSSLSWKSVNVWESALKKLKEIPDGQILRKLRISYDSLQDDHDKELFLHIACFFVEWDMDWVITILDECDFHTTFGIQNLIDRCLLAVNNSNKLTMHQWLQ